MGMKRYIVAILFILYIIFIPDINHMPDICPEYVFMNFFMIIIDILILAATIYGIRQLDKKYRPFQIAIIMTMIVLVWYIVSSNLFGYFCSEIESLNTLIMHSPFYGILQITSLFRSIGIDVDPLILGRITYTTYIIIIFFIVLILKTKDDTQGILKDR